MPVQLVEELGAIGSVKRSYAELHGAGTADAVDRRRSIVDGGEADPRRLVELAEGFADARTGREDARAVVLEPVGVVLDFLRACAHDTAWAGVGRGPAREG